MARAAARDHRYADSTRRPAFASVETPRLPHEPRPTQHRDYPVTQRRESIGKDASLLRVSFEDARRGRIRECLETADESADESLEPDPWDPLGRTNAKRAEPSSVPSKRERPARDEARLTVSRHAQRRLVKKKLAWWEKAALEAAGLPIDTTSRTRATRAGDDRRGYGDDDRRGEDSATRRGTRADDRSDAKREPRRSGVEPRRRAPGVEPTRRLARSDGSSRASRHSAASLLDSAVGTRRETRAPPSVSSSSSSLSHPAPRSAPKRRDAASSSDAFRFQLEYVNVITKLSGAARASATGDGEDLRMRAAIAEALRERMGDRTLVDQVKHDALHRLRRQDAQR